jgi:flagellar basal-body rod protein FlgF
MTDVLAISLQGMQQDMARVERISLNLANAMTPGYKREVVTALPMGGAADAGTFATALSNTGISQPGAYLGASPSAQPDTQPGIQSDDTGAPPNTASTAGLLLIQTDARPGTLKPTGQSLDLALTGPGYFEISTEGGLAYTRQGSWQLDARGRLVTPQGDPVMGQGGEIVLMHPHPVIDAAGQVFEAKADGGAEPMPVAQLKVVQFFDSNTKNMQRIGEGLVITDQPPTQVADSELQVRQGFLENSNVSSMQEMVQLIQSMRHFESLQRVAMGYDEMIGSAVRKLGEPA